MRSPGRIAALFVFLLLCGAATWWVVDGPPSAAPAPTDTGAVADGAQRVAEVGGNDDENDPQRVTAVTSTAAEKPGTPAAANLPLVVTGRCVDGDGAPLSDCTVHTRLGDDAEREAPDATSGDDGAFELEREVDGERALALRITADGRVPVSAELPRPLPGEDIDLGEVVLRGAIAVHGQLVDTAGVGVPNALVQFVRIDLTAGTRPTGLEVRAEPESTLATMSGPDGRFRFEQPAWPGEWFLATQLTGALVEPRNVQLGTDQRDFELRIVVERPDPEFTIHGRVVDGLGNPVDGAELTLIGHGYIGRGRSASDGRFVAHRAGPMSSYGREGMRVDCDHDSRAFNALDEALYTDIQWGDEDVEIVLHRRVGRSVRVVDESGAPVRRYTLLPFYEIVRRFSPYRHLRIRGDHPDGRCTLTGLTRGRQALIVVPADAELASTELVTFEVGHETQGPEQLVTVRRRVPLRVAVRSSDGAPVEGSTVELLQGLGNVVTTPTSPATLLADCDRSRGPVTHLIIARGTTGSDGQVELAAPPGDWELRVRGKAHVGLVQALQVTPPQTTLPVTVELGGRLHGQVHPQDALEQLVELTGGRKFAVHVDPGEEGLPSLDIPVDDQGRFAAAGIAPGRYRVQLHAEYASSEFHLVTDGWPIDELELRDGTDHTLDIDASRFLPATVHGRVLVDGQPLREVHCFLHRQGGPRGPRMVRVGTDAEGRFTALVRPGDYGFSITIAAHPGPGWIRIPLLDQSWRFEPANTHEQLVTVTLRRARLRLVDADDQPLADQLLTVLHSDYHLPGDLRTDADGWIDIDPAPPGPFRVRIELDGERRDLGPVDLPDGARSGDLVIRAG